MAFVFNTFCWIEPRGMSRGNKKMKLKKKKKKKRRPFRKWSMMFTWLEKHTALFLYLPLFSFRVLSCSLLIILFGRCDRVSSPSFSSFSTFHFTLFDRCHLSNFFFFFPRSFFPSPKVVVIMVRSKPVSLALTLFALREEEPLEERNSSHISFSPFLHRCQLFFFLLMNLGLTHK